MNAIEIKNVSKIFRENGRDFYALKNVSLNIEKGKIFGLLGPNGAGKTTLLNILINLLTEEKGSVRVLGKDPHSNRDVLDRVGFVSGMSRFHWALRPLDILKIYSVMYNVPPEIYEKRIKNLVRFFSLQTIIPKKFYLLSTGEKMRLIFAKSLLHHPDILMLDEPTLGLDPDMAIHVRNEIKRINRQFRTTIFLTSHYMHEVEYLADRIAFIDKGEIIDTGTVRNIKRKNFGTYQVIITVDSIKNVDVLKKSGFSVKGKKLTKTLPIGENISSALHGLIRKKFRIINVETKMPTLEDYFIKITSRDASAGD